MADAHTTSPGVSEPIGTRHRHERPEDWGWHGAFGKWSRIGAWMSVLVLVSLNFTWHYNQSADPWLFGAAAMLVLILIRDRYRRKNAWRDQ